MEIVVDGAVPSLEKIAPARQAQSPQARTADSSSVNTVSFLSARTTKTLRPPVGTNCGNAAPTPTSFAEIVSDDLRPLHAHPSTLNVFWSP